MSTLLKGVPGVRDTTSGHSALDTTTKIREDLSAFF